VKSSQTESKPAHISAGVTPNAMQAFISRAPSMWVASPASCAIAATASSCTFGQTAPPPIFAVCSTSTSAWLAAYRPFGVIAAFRASGVNMPRSPLSARTPAPAFAHGPPCSLVTICAVSCAMISSPGRQCTRIAIWLHIVPDGRNTAASLPRSAAIRSVSAHTVGSSPCCSSPTSAAIIAAFMAADGFVCVSE